MKKYLKSFWTILSVTLIGSTAFGAGFEKSVSWGAKEMGRGGTAVSTTKGPDALYFNPAGLVDQDSIQGLTFNFSPTFSEFKHPVLTADTQETSEQAFSPLFGINYNYKIMDNLAVGMGGYVAGGNNVEYKDLDTVISAFDVSPKAGLTLTELGIGVGYEVMEGLSLGLTWRISFVSGEFVQATSTTVAPGVGVATETAFEDLEATEYSGVKFGIIYAPEETWGVGLSYRSEVEFEAEGKATLMFANNTGVTAGGIPNTGGAVVSSTDDDVKLKASLPQQINIGGHYMVMPDLMVAFEYSWTEYSKIDKIELIDFASATEVETKWKDQNVIRLGVEWSGMGFPLRFGYVNTSQVTPDEAASATFATPASGHDITIGGGYALMDGLNLDVALDYAFASADIDNADSTNGKYESSAYQLHFGATYMF